MLHAQSPAARRLAAMGANVPARGYRNGGLIDGPGDETSDSIDIKASKGEFMLPADTTRKVGVKRLNDLIERTHKPSGKAKRAAHYADGGLVTDDERRRRSSFGDAAAGSRDAGVQQVASASAQASPGAGIDQIPMDTNIQAPKPDGSMDSAFNTETGRNLQAVANSVGGLGGALPAIAKTGGAISSWLGRAGGALQGASAAAVGSAGTPAAAGLLPSADASAPANPQSSGVATPAAPGPASTAAATAPAPEAAQPAKAGWDRTNMTNAQVGQSNPSGRVRMERLADGSTSFSGDNVSGPVSYTDAAGKAVPGAGINGAGFGGFQVNPARGTGMGKGPGSSQTAVSAPGFAAPQVAHSGNDWEAANNLRNLAVSASSITNNGGRYDSRQGRANSGPSLAQAAYLDAQRADLTARGQQPGLENSTNQINAGLRREGMQQAGANQREAMRNDIDRGRLTLEQIASDERSRSNSRIEEAQDALFSAQTPEKQRAAQTRLLALMGKGESTKDRFVTAGGGTYVQDGQTVKEPTTIYDSVTQQWLRPPASSQPSTPPPKDKLVNGQIYNLPDGRSMRWNGSSFLPAN